MEKLPTWYPECFECKQIMAATYTNGNELSCPTWVILKISQQERGEPLVQNDGEEILSRQIRQTSQQMPWHQHRQIIINPIFQIKKLRIKEIKRSCSKSHKQEGLEPKSNLGLCLLNQCSSLLCLIIDIAPDFSQDCVILALLIFLVTQKVFIIQQLWTSFLFFFSFLLFYRKYFPLLDEFAKHGPHVSLERVKMPESQFASYGYSQSLRMRAKL